MSRMPTFKDSQFDYYNLKGLGKTGIRYKFRWNIYIYIYGVYQFITQHHTGKIDDKSKWKIEAEETDSSPNFTLENSWQDRGIPTRHRCARSVTYWQTWTNDSAQLEGSVGPWLTKRGCERGGHYHIMLVCNYKLSYPRVNPLQIYISSRALSNIDSSRSIPLHPQPAPDPGGIRSNVKNDTTMRVTRRSDSIRYSPDICVDEYSEYFVSVVPRIYRWN